MTWTPKVRQIAFGVYIAIRNCGDAYKTGILYQMPYLSRDVGGRPGTGVSAHSTRLRLYVRLPGGWFWYSYQPQHINNLNITTILTHQESCPVVCFFIGPGGYHLPQYTDNQYYQSFITRQVVQEFHTMTLRLRKNQDLSYCHFDGNIHPSKQNHKTRK